MVDILETKVKKRARRRWVIQAALASADWDGSGVEAAVLAEARDPLLDAQIQAEASVAGALAAQQANLQNAGACLDELIRFSAAPNGLDGLTADLSDLFRPFEILSSDPANLPLRRSVVQSALDVAAQLNRAAFRLNALKSGLNDSIQKDVVQANRDLNDVASLNQQIKEAQASIGRVAILADQRGQYLERLSGCVNIMARPQADGSVDVSVVGVTMVAGSETPDSLATYPDKDENLQMQAQNAGKRLKLAGGSIAGKITARNGVLAGLQCGLDKLASQLIARFNSIYSSGVGSNGGAGIFLPGPMRRTLVSIISLPMIRHACRRAAQPRRTETIRRRRPWRASAKPFPIWAAPCRRSATI